jgi:RNA polymerase sigma factor (sigma-70 family)
MSDWELIQQYCRNGSESAFETLVKRHVDFVYCAALRQVRDPSLAEDVSQAVFLLLARKARSFRSGTVLVSWLFRTTRFIASRALRSEYRRQRRELEAAKMNPPSTASETDHDWERVAPVLDEALAALADKDRDAVLLRFISRKPFSRIGAEIGLTEDAAKKRVSRALGRLREFFVRRGTTLSVAAIAVLLGERVAQASPTVLATKITAALSAGASAAASSSAGALVATAMRDLFWANVTRGAAISACVIGALLLLSTTFRPVANDAKNPTHDTPTVQTETVVDSRSTVSNDVNTNENTTNRTLSLLVLQSEDRQPVAGARVWVDCWIDTRPQRTLDALTDRDGLLQIPIPTREFREMVVWISADGRVAMEMRWHEHEFNEPVISHTLYLEPAQPAAGIVLAETGNPIAGAKVSFRGPGIDLAKRENREYHPDLSASFTDADGRWATTQIPMTGERPNMQVTHPDFIPTSAGYGGPPGFLTNVITVLSNGVALSGRITAADGTPIRNAYVAKQSGTYLSTRTDADGRFHWPHIEPGQVFVDVEAKGFETIHEFVWATNAANECAFTMKEISEPVRTTSGIDAPRVHLHGSVVDAETGEPIPDFKVLLGDGMSMLRTPAGEGVLLLARLLGEGHNGQFDWQTLPGSSTFRLQVEAEGYLESVSEERNHETAEREFSFKLKRGVILIGRVTTPDGSVAENAVVSLTGAGIGPTMQSPGKLLDPNPGFETTRTRTDSEGKFRLRLKTGARGVAVVHESGFALLTFAAATNEAVVLKPWGAIDGTLYLNGQPAPNQTVYVSGIQKLDADPRLMFSFAYRTNTDEGGHFRFNQVLPGEHSVARAVGFFAGGGPGTVNFDHATKVKVESGAVASVELRRQGRPVIGKIVLQGARDEVQWGTSTAFLKGEKQFPFGLSKDGILRADDVAPGTYTLSIQLESATIGPANYQKPPFGSLQKEVTVPPADDESAPVDLGELTIKRGK